MAFDISTILGSNLGQMIKDVVGTFHLDPAIKAQISEQIDANAALLKEKEMELNTNLNTIAGQNIRAEEQSGDKYTSRARPTVIWWGMGMIVFNYTIVNMLSHWMHITPVDLPSAFWWTWGTVVTGYVFNRSAQEIMSMPGESSIKVGPISLGQNSPK